MEIALAVSALQITMAWLVFKNQRAETDRVLARLDLHEKWLFESLYSISHKVVLPEEHGVEYATVPAKVTTLRENPMSEFKGDLDDWHS